jgi:hypothetical protein
LMLIGIVAVIVQKSREGDAKELSARGRVAGILPMDDSQNAREQLMREVVVWQYASLAAVCLSIASWIVAVWRREKLRGSWVVFLAFFVFYVMLELEMI